MTSNSKEPDYLCQCQSPLIHALIIECISVFLLKCIVKIVGYVYAIVKKSRWTTVLPMAEFRIVDYCR